MPTRRLNFGFGSEGDETAGGPALLLLCVAMRLLRVVAQRRCVLLYSAVVFCWWRYEQETPPVEV